MLRLIGSFALLPVVAILASLGGGCGPRRDEPLTVFAAASLTDGLDRGLAAWEAEGHEPARASYAASSTLARQIEEGAPADLFLSANEAWMDRLQSAGRLATGTRIDLLGNDLVLVTRRGSGIAPDPSDGAAFAAAIPGRLAIADPGHVPAGIYGEQALWSIGAWGALANRLAVAGDVRGALTFVARGECAAGIVYATDAAVEDDVVVAARFPEDSHAPILYPAAAVNGGRIEAAAALLAWLAGERGRAIFAEAGFRVPAGTAR